VGSEKLADMDLTPEQRRIRELEAKEAERLKQDEDAKGKETEAKRTAEVERHKEQLADTFMQAMELANLPKSAARFAFPRLARIYETADAVGLLVSPEQAAEVMRSGLMDEHKSLYSRRTEKGEELDVDALAGALTHWFGEDAWKAINRHAVGRFRASRAAGSALPLQPQQPPTEAQPQAGGKPARGGNFWKDLDKRHK
jgi:hypothetical protein